MGLLYEKIKEDLERKIIKNENEQTYKIFRIRGADGEPLTINTSYIPCRYLINFNISKLIDVQSLYKILEEDTLPKGLHFTQKYWWTIMEIGLSY